MTTTTGPENLGATLLRHAPVDAETSPQPPVAPATRYRPGRELGRGGMGRVVEAVDAQFDRLVAVKELLGPANAPAVQRFRTEALITGNLEHPGIPAVHEQGVNERGVPFYVMQRVAGRTLSECCRRSGSLRERLELVPAVMRVAQTVGFAHARGVIHRDLKPDNVVVGSHGETYLLDWGIAKVKGVPDSSAPRLSAPEGAGSATSAGVVLGTPAYMAPEQARGEVGCIDERTDVFALGAMLFHVLTGRPPYGGTHVEELVEAARRGAVPRVKQVAPDVPAPLRAICEKAMAMDPDRRYPDANAFVSALEAYTADSLGGSRRAVDWLVNGFAVLLTLSLVMACVLATMVMPSIVHQGPGAAVNLFMGACGVVLAVVEVATRSRYRLWPVVLAVAGIGVCATIGMTALDVLVVLQTIAQRPEVLADGTAFRSVLIVGLQEALGKVPLAFLFMALQLVLLGFAQRWNRATR